MDFLLKAITEKEKRYIDLLIPDGNRISYICKVENEKGLVSDKCWFCHNTGI